MLAAALCIRTRIYRDGLAATLQAHGDVGEVRACENLDQLRRLLAAAPSDVLLVDTRFDKRATAAAEAEIQAARALARGSPIVALGFDEDDDEIVALLEAGAAAYLTTNNSIDDLVSIMHAAARGELCCTPRIARRLQERLAGISAHHSSAMRLDKLSRRELQVLDLVRLGRSNKEIARTLCLELSTVKNHIHNVIAKLNVSSRREAASVAMTT